MAITIVDELQAQDWDRYAAFIGPFLPPLVLGIAVLGFIIGQHVGTQVCALLIAMLLAVLETPGAYFLCPPCQRLRDLLIEEAGLGKGWVRGVLYAVLSLACFLPRPSVAILAGLLLDLAALLYVCASLFADEPIAVSSTAAASSKFSHASVLPSYQPPAAAAAAAAAAATAATGGGAGAAAKGTKSTGEGTKTATGGGGGFGTFSSV